MAEKDKTKIKISDLLRSHPEGLTIQEIMNKTGLARHTILARLHGLIGEDKIGVRQINMAKLHNWKSAHEDEEHKEKTQLKPLKEEHIKDTPKRTFKKGDFIDESKIKEQINKKLSDIKGGQKEKQILEQREPITHLVQRSSHKGEIKHKEFIKTGIEGLDNLLELGIPKGTSVLLAGGAGSGKTLMALQILHHQASLGKKCLYMSFEESEEKLTQHMEDFGWNPKELEKKNLLKIQRFNPFDITRNVDALLMKAKGELLIDIEPIIFPGNFKPEFIVVDSLTAIASAFIEKEDTYRIYIEQLFRFFENIKATTLLITETKQIPTIFSQSGVEEFLADGVIVLYSIKKGNIRENAIEVLKLRGAKHQKKIVAMQITEQGIVVYPEQEVFGEI